jgi:hypothetical protein
VFTIEKLEDFSLFIASEKAKEIAEPVIEKANKSNKEFLSKQKPSKPKMSISGTFIYAHPPNYRGRPMQNYSINDWMRLMQELKLIGMDTIILQASIWNELQECYYPSKCFKNFKQWDMIDPMLKAAKNSSIKVYLGGYGSVAGWKEHLTQKDIDQEKRNHAACIDELLKYNDLFEGIYFAPETAFSGERDIKKENFLNEIYKEFCVNIKNKAPEKKILMSPATKYFPGRMKGMIESWSNILNEVPLDIMAPQDSIGTCENELVHQKETYKAWNEICKEKKIIFWSNIEIFERKPIIKGINHSIPASFERIIVQINNAAPYAKKLICWEAPYYLLEDAPKSNTLRNLIGKQL